MATSLMRTKEYIEIKVLRLLPRIEELEQKTISKSL